MIDTSHNLICLDDSDYLLYGVVIHGFIDMDLYFKIQSMGDMKIPAACWPNFPPKHTMKLIVYGSIRSHPKP